MLLQVQLAPIVFVLAAVAFLFVATTVGPLALLRVRDAREPTEDEAAIVSNLLDPAGFSPAVVRVLDTVGEASISVTIRGPPGYRYLLVSDYVLETLDPEIAAPLVAAEVERARLLYLEYRIAAAAAVLGIATAMFAGWLDFGDGLFAIAVAALVLFWLGRRLQFLADRRAGDRVGAAALAGAFEAVADIRGVTPREASLGTWVEIQPPLGQRIDRLRER